MGKVVAFVLFLIVCYLVSREEYLPGGVEEIIVSINDKPVKIYYRVLKEIETDSGRDTTYILQDELESEFLEEDALKYFWVRVKVCDNANRKPKLVIDHSNLGRSGTVGALERMILQNNTGKITQNISNIIWKIEVGRISEILKE